MIADLGGLPSHPLVVHIPAVLVPLCAIGVIAMAIRSAWLQRYGGLVAGLTVVGLAGSVLAANTGEELEDKLRAAGESITGVLHDHIQLGERTEWVVALFCLSTVVWVGLAWWWRRRPADARPRRSRTILGVLAALAVATGVWSTVTVIQTGHDGAKSKWEESAP